MICDYAKGMLLEDVLCIHVVVAKSCCWALCSTEAIMTHTITDEEENVADSSKHGFKQYNFGFG